MEEDNYKNLLILFAIWLASGCELLFSCFNLFPSFMELWLAYSIGLVLGVQRDILIYCRMIALVSLVSVHYELHENISWILFGFAPWGHYNSYPEMY